jgi:LPXTG-site transpeptidase (sortase) family protein
LLVAGLASSTVLTWELWGSTAYAHVQQGRLSAQLAGQNPPSPLAALDEADRPDEQASGRRTIAGAALGPRDHAPALNSRPADITPFPPTGWSPPADRTMPSQPADGAAIGRLVIPRIKVDQTIVMGTAVSDLREGPGLWRGGAFPGTPGNSTIAGHRTTYGAPFYDVDQLRYGDLIIVDVPWQPRAVYEVRGRAIVPASEVSVTQPTPGVRLTLVTCHPVHSAAQRMVIQAELVEGAWLDKAVNRSRWVPPSRQG